MLLSKLLGLSALFEIQQSVLMYVFIDNFFQFGPLFFTWMKALLCLIGIFTIAIDSVK